MSRRIILNGVRGWESKRRRAKGRLFRTAKESKQGRIVKKTIGKTSWFRKPRMRGDKDEDSQEDILMMKKRGGEEATAKKTEYEKPKKTGEEHRIAAVLFVHNTREGLLAKKLREVVERIKNILGYKIKIVERAGTSLKQIIPLTRIGEEKECGRSDCVPCTHTAKQGREITSLHEKECFV